MTDDEQQDEQAEDTEDTYEEPEVEDLKSEDGPTSTAAGASNGGPG